MKNYFLKTICIAICLFIQPIISTAQIKTTINPLQRCGTTEKLDAIRANDPNFDQRNAKNEQLLQSWIANNYSNWQTKKAVITIPTVVQLWVNSSTVSDARVQEQIDVLNEDYRALNSDFGNVPSAFQGVAADCEIEFCLASQDPNGNSTNGIIRKTVGGSPNTSDNWDPTQYLNIYVYSLSGGVLGYTYTPGNAPNGQDAVNIDYRYFGKTGSSAPYNKGRTTTHEVGHWLNLEHVWGYGNGGCSQDDYVSDTPMQSSSYGGCPNYPQNSCSSSDMFMNYMDYVNDACMYMFTDGQKARMVAALNSNAGGRVNLLSSNGCGGSSSNANDAGISSIVSPNGTGCSTTITPVVTILNSGSSTLTSATINYNIDGGSNNTYSWTGSLSTNATQNVTLPSITVSSGTHTFNCSTSNPNGTTDQNSSNDAASQSFTISGSGSGAPLPFSEGFESSTFPPSGWTLDNPNSNATWSRVTTASGFGNSSACAQMNFFSGNEDITGQSDYLFTKDLDFGSAQSPVVMDFNLAYAQYGSQNYDSLIIWASTDCGASWTRIWQEGGSQMATAADNQNEFTPGSGDWKSVSINLNSFIGSSTLQIQFHAYSFWGNNLYIDDINISGGSSSTPPTATFTGSPTTICTGNSVSFTDQSTNSPSSWSWTFNGGTPSSSSSQNPTIIYNTPGTYSVSLTVSNSGGNDTETISSYITVNAGPNSSITTTNASCNGICDGSATASVSGGTPPYTYYWDTNPVQNTATISGVCAGTYNYSIADATGCTSTGSITITEPNSINITASTTNASCGASDGSATASCSGGSSPYTYQWDDPGNQNSSSANGLAAGVYTVTVTDANGCSNTSSVSVNNVGAPTLSVNSIDVLCNGNSDGQATVVPTGGTGPYNISWSNGQTTSTATNLSAGTYSVMVTDANNCAVSEFVTINEPPALTLSMAYINVSSASASDGQASANASGGTPPYMYAWTPGGQTSAVATGLSIETYNVIVTDANGCTSNGSIYVDLIPMGIDKPSLEDLISIYPNPTNGNIFITADLSINDLIGIEIYDITGKSISSININKNRLDKYSIDLSNQSNGLYFIVISSDNEQISKKISLIR